MTYEEAMRWLSSRTDVADAIASEAFERGVAEGIARERAAVVAWLLHYGHGTEWQADTIERGDHHPEHADALTRMLAEAREAGRREAMGEDTWEVRVERSQAAARIIKLTSASELEDVLRESEAACAISLDHLDIVERIRARIAALRTPAVEPKGNEP